MILQIVIDMYFAMEIELCSIDCIMYEGEWEEE